MALKLELDRDTRPSSTLERLDAAFDVPTDRTVNPADEPPLRRVKLCDLRCRLQLARASLSNHNDPLPDANGGAVVFNADDTRLPLGKMGRICDVRKHVV